MLTNVPTCDPVRFSRSLHDTLDSLVREDVLTQEEANAKHDCLFTYLRDYAAFAAATPKPTDEQVESLYSKTLTMLDGAVTARHEQKDDVEYQLEYLEEDLAQREPQVPVDEETLSLRQTCLDTVEGLDDDVKMLKGIKAKCEKASGRLDKVICIERFASATHTRGPYMSTACTFPLPERITGDDFNLALQDAGQEASEVAQQVLNCLAANPVSLAKLREAQSRYSRRKELERKAAFQRQASDRLQREYL